MVMKCFFETLSFGSITCLCLVIFLLWNMSSTTSAVPTAARKVVITHRSYKQHHKPGVPATKQPHPVHKPLLRYENKQPKHSKNGTGTHHLCLDHNLTVFMKKIDKNPFLYPRCPQVHYVWHHIERALKSSTGFVMGKIGGTEYHLLRHLAQPDRIFLDKTPHTNSGVYPITRELLRKWRPIYIKGLQAMNITVDFHQGFMKTYCRKEDTHILPDTPDPYGYAIFWPWYWKRPYTQLFANKTVLVVSPFSKYVEAQYHTNRTCIFPNRINVLPEFKELITVDAPLPPVVDGDLFNETTYIQAGVNSSFLTNLADLKRKVAAIDYDVMLIGAGSLALPLAAAEKQRGKVIIHLAGNLGPLFGLKGGRFDKRPEYFQHFYNDCWIHMEKPAAASRMEDSAYW